LPSLSLPTLRALQSVRHHRFVQRLGRHRSLWAVGLAALFAFWLFGRADSTSDSAKESAKAAQKSAAETSEGAAQKAQTRADKPTKAPPAAATSAQVDGDEDPEEAVERSTDSLLNGRARETRRAAAKVVVRNADEAPRYLQLVADLELSDRCQEKKRVLADMQELGDKRVVPALERLAEQPRRGCGLIKLSDCLGCLRRELATALTAFGR
jgi:hypothetical protein